MSGKTIAAEEAGNALRLKELSYSEDENIELIFQALLSRHVDGIIWAVPEIGENRSWVRRPINVNVPIVYLTMEPQESISIVSVNNYEGGRLATSHLLEQGYRNIGHIAGPLSWWEARQRSAGWKDTLLEAGVECRTSHCVEGNWSSASGARAAKILFEQYPQIDAVFVANDQMALGVVKIAHQRGMRIPEDIGVVGFDNILESAYFLPSLTTVQQDQYHVARVAVEQIIKIIEFGRQGLNPVGQRSIILPPTLIVRQSSTRKMEGGERPGS